MATIKDHLHQVDDPASTVIPPPPSDADLASHEAAADPHPGYTTAAELATGLATKFDDPVSIPEVPATPDAQDVVDALVTLGLVTQAP